ncbi:flagellar biosynthesis anti-sigma factor FlgM [Citrobacter sp. S2-9]|uniref:Negative regulator of flagellin synthesis n=1 Tax=Citrobacter enshiensis TaxID=2971264 RepID=A0ABT8PQ17_9ENTR|nr:flagellar biosynthesis anti-sigma factor FlgM [Citrobacter enshiensis]MDN8598425.1 flagellar biosynthesis anti-sigma factor FlgM [Citrobacter enshiensis]
MKITPTISGSNPMSTSATERATTSTAQTSSGSTLTISADDITQAGLQSAQQTLNNDNEGDVDYDKVARMQAAIASGEMQVDTNQLASDMLSYFQK